MNISISELLTKKLKEAEKIKEIEDNDWRIEPPTFDEFIYSGEYINKVKLTKLAYDSIITVIGNDPKKIFSPERVYSLGVWVVGKGGGKGYVLAVLDTYIITVLLCLKNPQNFLKLEENLDIVNVATTKKQATDIFFFKFKERVKQNKFFRKYYKIYEENRVVNNPRDALGVIKIGTSQAEFPNNIRCFAETSDNESWEGKSVIFFVLDEISGFVSEKGYFTGRKIYDTAISSCISRRSSNFKGLGFVISYPRQEINDIIIELWNESKKKENVHMYGVFAFAWHFKPIIHDNVDSTYVYYDEKDKEWKYRTYTFLSKRFNRFFGYVDEDEVGMEIPLLYKEAFDENPEKALTQYCCLPPRGAGNYIEYQDKIMSAVNRKIKPLFLTRDYEEIRKIENISFNYLYKAIKECSEPDIQVRMHEYDYVAWVDLGETLCEACIAIGRKGIRDRVDKKGNIDRVEIVEILDVLNWTPIPERNVIVDLVNVEEFLVKEFKKWIKLKIVGADKWNSATLANRLTKVGITPLTYNLGLKHYEVAKELFYKGQVEIFNEEEWVNRSKKEQTSLEQLLSLTATAINVKKREGFMKDKIDSVVGVINLVMGNLFTDKKRPAVQHGKVPTPIRMGNYAQPTVLQHIDKKNEEVEEDVEYKPLPPIIKL